MPITSTDVSNIIAGQIGMFSASSQYSQAISAQYGFSPSGSPFGADPRANVAPGNLMGGAGMASAGARMPGMAMGGLGMAAMFNAAPRMFDPFTSTMHAGAMGYRAAGVGGAIGMGGMTALGYGAMAGAGSWMTNQIATGAQNRGMITSAAQGMMPNQSVGGLNAVANQVESMHRQGMGSLRELTGIMQGGAMSGAVDTGSLQRFSSSFQKLVNNVRQVAVALNTTMTQAQQAMQQVEGMGISNSNAAGFLGTARAFGAQTGIGPQQMMQYAAGGASFARGAGIDRSIGATGAITQAGIYGLANKWGQPGILPDSYSKHMQGASRFLMGRSGRAVLGAMMDPNTGELNAGVARQMSAGLLDRNEILSLSKQNLGGNLDMFNSRRGELAAGFLSQYGPHAASGALGAMTSNRAQPMSTQMALTGLTRSDITGMKSLNQSAGALQSQLVAEAQRGFREGSTQQSLGGALGQAWENLIKPIRDEFRQLGAGMTKSMQGALQSMTEEFVRSPPPNADPRSRMMQFEKALTGSGRDEWSQGGRYRGLSGGLGLYDSSPTGVLSSVLPQGFRIGRMSPGTSLDELSGYGLGTESWNPYLTGGVAASRATYQGRNALGWLGRGANEVGRGVAAFGGTPQATGFLGSGGIGGPGSWMRGLGNTISGAGWAARGLGFATRTLAPLGIAYDAVTNTGPAAMRRAGYSPVTQGAITGSQRNMMESLGQAGVFGDDPFEDIKTKDISGETPPGMTPLGGFLPGSAQGGGGFGTQRFIKGKAIAAAKAVFSPQYKNKVLKRIGGNMAPVQEAVRKAKEKYEAANGAGTWSSLDPGAQVTNITEELHKNPDKKLQSLTTADVFSLAKDVGGAITNMPQAMDDTFNPDKVREDTANELQQFSDVASGVALSTGKQKVKDWQNADLNRLGKTLHSKNKGTAAGIISLTEQGEENKLKLDQLTFGAEGNFADQLRAGNISLNTGAIRGLVTKEDIESGKFHGAGDLALGKGSDEATAHQSQIASHIAADMNMSTKLAGFQKRWRDAKENGDVTKMQEIKDEWSRYKYNQDGYRQAFKGTMGEDYSPNRDVLAEQELNDNNLTKAAALQDLSQATAYWDNARSDFKSEQGQNRMSNINTQASRLSGGTSAATTALGGIMKTWHGADSAQGTLPKGDPHLTARKQLIKHVQQRLQGGMGNATAADIEQAVGQGGVMSLDDVKIMQQELAASNMPGHQDLAHSLGSFIKTREITRTKEGKKRTAKQVLKRSGIDTGKLGPEDIKFLENKSDVMSTRLEGEFNKMAISALRATLDHEPTKAQMDERSIAIQTALRKGNMNEYENLVSTTGAPHGVGSTQSGKKAGAMTAQAGEFSKAMAAATTAANSFASNVGKK